MPTAPHAVAKAAVAVLCLLALVGCSGVGRQPTDYGEINAKGEGYYGNLMFGCTGVQPNEKGEYVAPKGEELLSSADYCKCLFKGLKDSVPFKIVKEYEEKQADAKEGEMPEIPKGIREVRDDCEDQV